MQVKTLIEMLKKVENQDGWVEIPVGDGSFDYVVGISVCEENTGIILCDENTFEAFSS